MPKIKSFKALIYNPAKVNDMSKVMAPPYDVISEEMQNQLQMQSPYNFTHIDYAKDSKGDNESDNKYTRARTVLDSWIKDKIMQIDKEPSIYIYKQEYKVMGEKHSRLGFISLLELEDEKDSRVKPHEKTHKYAVDDRLFLTRSLESNLSCIFVCYSDQKRKVEKIFHKHIVAADPILDVTDADQVHHRVWRLSDSELIEEVNKTVEDQNLFIADGHHRYQVACDYRNERMKDIKNPKGDEPFNYVMTYFTNLDSKDLKIFPMHRVLKTFPEDLTFLEDFFRIDKVKTKQELLILLAKAGLNEHAFGLYTKDNLLLLRLKNKTLIDQHIKKGSKEYKGLDATILKHFVFDKVGIPSVDITYSKDMEESTNLVDNGEMAAAFIMNAVKISQLKNIALNGERMPPKTTYFYPKVLSGLTAYKMGDS